MTSNRLAHCIDTLLLLALPASGKSVILRYLGTVSPDVAESDFHLGRLIQLDDFPYVHLMWRISEVTEALGYEPVFFDVVEGRFRDPRDLGTLIHLLNQDDAALTGSQAPVMAPPAEWIMDRFESARALAGMPAPFGYLDKEARTAMATAIEDETAAFAAAWSARSRPPDSTLVIEFSRGGPEGSDLPLDPPYGYAHALSQLSVEILRRAAVLYVWVTPEESRRRNRARAKPGGEGSTLHHTVPETAMRADFGMDDMGWLIDHSEQPGTITVHAHGATFHLPVACYDNRRDLTLFQRDDPSTWRPQEAAEVHTQLREAFARLGGDTTDSLQTPNARPD